MKIENNFYNVTSHKEGFLVCGIKDVVEFQEFVHNNKGIAPDIPEGVISIYEDIFKNIYDIKGIYIPASVKELPSKLFAANKDVIINYGNYYDLIVREITPDKKYEPTYKLKNIRDNEVFNTYCIEHEGNNPPVPFGVTSISDFVFKDNLELKTLTLPESVICICKQGCKNCANLKKVNLSSNFLDFGEEVFMNCSGLSGEFVLPKSLCILRANVFKGCSPDLKIKIFDEQVCSVSDFILKGSLENLPSIVELDCRKDNKSIRTNDALYVLKNGECFFVEKSHLKSIIRFNKTIGEKIDCVDEIFVQNKGLAALEFVLMCEKYNRDFPLQYIVCKSIVNKIENYLKNEEHFSNSILTKMRQISTYKTADKNGNLVGRLTHKQYCITYVLACLTGYFENEELRQKSISFFEKGIFNFFNNSKYSVNLTLEEYERLFEGLLDIDCVDYNKEFSKYFLFNVDNLRTFIAALKEKLDVKSFLKMLVNNSGFSNIMYSHDDTEDQSSGKLHDRWIVYKANNNNKVKNDGVEKEKINVLNFIDWACEFGDGSDLLEKYKENAEEHSTIQPFLKFYADNACLDKLVNIFSMSKETSDYIFFPKDSEYIQTQELILDITKVGSPIVVKRKFLVSKYDNAKLKEIEEIYKENKKYLTSKTFDQFYGKIMDKPNPLIAYANCEMGHCANVRANGIEYLYESYLDCDCQPIMLFKFEEGKDIPIANFRINIDRKKGVGTITCLEVKTEVKFNYTREKQINVVRAFYKTIENFIALYNKYNKIKVSKITMGQISHCDINDVLSDYFSILDYPIKCNKHRKVVAPSEYNHFLIWEEGKTVQGLMED